MRIIILMVFMLIIMPVHHAEAAGAPVISKMIGFVVVKHNGNFTRATQGMQLAAGDEVRTGYYGKAYIDFPDNSRVKIGVRSEFKVREWDVSNNDVFTSSFAILKGAFRYTAGKLSGWRNRNTQVFTNTAVIGVRGTDFWGRVANDNTFFLLIEGSVSLTPHYGQAITYDKAGHAVNIQSSISMPKALSMEDITPLAMETEISE